MHNNKCLICERIEKIKLGTNPYFIKEFETGYAVLGDHQYFNGYCLFLCKRHKAELHELDKNFRTLFLQEMSILAEAVYKTFKPDKLNYELLGNSERHLHWHLFPRYKTDLMPKRTVWAIDKSIRNSEEYKLTPQQIKETVEKILENL